LQVGGPAVVYQPGDWFLILADPCSERQQRRASDD
jgi:hypothetical protein